MPRMSTERSFLWCQLRFLMRRWLLVLSLTPPGYSRFRFLSVKSHLSYDSVLWSMDSEQHWHVMVYPGSGSWHWLPDPSYLQSPKSIREDPEPGVGMGLTMGKKMHNPSTWRAGYGCLCAIFHIILMLLTTSHMGQECNHLWLNVWPLTLQSGDQKVAGPARRQLSRDFQLQTDKILVWVKMCCCWDEVIA